MKSLLILFSFSTQAFVPGLLEQGRLMVGLMEEARTCSVEYLNGELKLCTGLKLEKNDIKFLKNLDLNSCKLFLKQMKYNVHEVIATSDILEIKKEVIDDFFNSTKLAWILHRERAILFKREARRGDCIHEVIHFYQRERPNVVSLSPLKRKEYERRLQFLLEEAVAEVEKVEKTGDKEKAQEMAGKLGPFIDLQREWQRLIHWLDEKEIYQVFFDHPDLFDLGERDQDIALSNLVRLKDSLPWDLRERVLRGAQLELNKKYARVSTPKNLLKFKTEKEYSDDFNKGKISRDTFEERVIARRKHNAYELVKEGRRKGKLSSTLEGLALARVFSKAAEFESPQVKFFYQVKKELPQVEINGVSFVIDTGAQVSVAPWPFLKGFKESDLTLLNQRQLRSFQGKSVFAPVVQIKRDILVGGVSLKGLTFSIGDLGISGVEGVLGMDFFRRFNKGRWLWDGVSKKIGPLNPKAPLDKTYYLEGNGLKEYDALEFYCSKKRDVKLRLDTGSQILGDAQKNASEASLKACLDPQTIKKLNKLSPGVILFDRNVSANLGFPFLNSFHSMGMDLEKGELYFSKMGMKSGQ